MISEPDWPWYGCLDACLGELGSACSKPKWLMFSCHKLKVWAVRNPRGLGACALKHTVIREYSVSISHSSVQVHSNFATHTWCQHSSQPDLCAWPKR